MLLLAACTLPSAAPTMSQLEESAQGSPAVFLVTITPSVERAMSGVDSAIVPDNFRLPPGGEIVLQPGDTVAVTIYETGIAPLFGAGSRSAPSGGGIGMSGPQSTTLPSQTIERDGDITIPFAGSVSIAGLTPLQAGVEIERALRPKTVSPEVIVSLVQNNGNVAVVSGEVNRAGVIPLSLRGERILDILSQAGGSRFPPAAVDIRVIRGGSSITLPLASILSNPLNNIVVRPGDTIIALQNPKSYVVMGAAAKVAQYDIQTDRVTLVEAIAKAGGTIDAISDLSGVYLLRNESPAIARKILTADVSAVDDSYASPLSDETVPGINDVQILYRLNLMDANGYFMARKVTLRDKDIVLVANAESTQIQKVLALLGGVTRLYYDIGRSGSVFDRN